MSRLGAQLRTGQTLRPARRCRWFVGMPPSTVGLCALPDARSLCACRGRCRSLITPRPPSRAVALNRPSFLWRNADIGVLAYGSAAFAPAFVACEVRREKLACRWRCESRPTPMLTLRGTLSGQGKGRLHRCTESGVEAHARWLRWLARPCGAPSAWPRAGTSGPPTRAPQGARPSVSYSL